MRKQVLVVFVLLAALAATLAAPEAEAVGRRYATPAGTWFAAIDFEFIVDPGPPPEILPFELAWLQNFDADGRTIGLLPFGAGHPNEGDSRVGCMGEWAPRRGDGHTFDLTMRCNYNQDPEGAYGLIRGIMTMIDKDNMEYEFSYVDYEADGTLLYDQGWGVATCTRVKVDPLP